MTRDDAVFVWAFPRREVLASCAWISNCIDIVVIQYFGVMRKHAVRIFEFEAGKDIPFVSVSTTFLCCLLI